MELQFRVRVYQSASELEGALHQEAQNHWELKQLCAHGPSGVLAVYTSTAPRDTPREIENWDRAALAAQEANLTHEFSDPREED